jgi:alkylhydroperoxidase/carboxymuconolactone decarboxylase family protein YurZ
MSLENLPPLVQQLAEQYPAVWSAYNRLGEAAAAAGPLDAKTRRLVKLALAIGGEREGGVHSHVRRGLMEGLTREELQHVALLATTTLGWPAAVRAYSWVDDELGEKKSEPSEKMKPGT